MLQVNALTLQINQKKLLDQVGFNLFDGSLLAVIGSNGAGKSTLLNAISQYEQRYTGSIYWNGEDMRHSKTLDLARTRAVLTQKIHMSQPYLSEDVVMMGRYPYFHRIPQQEDYRMVHQKMELTGTLHFRERNYDTLSGGEAQRIQLARVLAQLQGKNNLLMLDEPLNNLDVKHQFQTLSICKEFAKAGNTVIVVLHDINLAAAFADQILLLHEGRQIGFGSPESVLQEDLLFSCYGCPVHIARHPFRNCLNIVFDTHTEFIES